MIMRNNDGRCFRSIRQNTIAVRLCIVHINTTLFNQSREVCIAFCAIKIAYTINITRGYSVYQDALKVASKSSNLEPELILTNACGDGFDSKHCSPFIPKVHHSNLQCKPSFILKYEGS